MKEAFLFGSEWMIEARELTKVYKSKKRTVIGVEDVSFRVEKGEIFGIVGYSGAGKISLLRCINLLERPTSGTIKVDGIDLTKLNSSKLREALVTLSHRIVKK